MDFKVLSLSEEDKLSRDEKLLYYKKLRDFAKDRKLVTTTSGAKFLGHRMKGITNKLSSKLTDILCEKDFDYNVEGIENIPECTVLFAFTHQGLLDNFSWIPDNPQHCVIFHSTKVRKALKLMQLNTGLVLVDKEDKKSRLDAKMDGITLLLNGVSVAFFPEAAYLLSPNKYHLPINYGFLDVARKAGVPIVPCVIDYFYSPEGKITDVNIGYCRPMFVSVDDSLSEKLIQYQEIISTKRHDFIEKRGIFKRDDILNLEYINFMESTKKVLQMAKIDLDVERRTIWDSNSPFYDFHHINDIPYDEHGNFLEPEEVKRLKKINKRHNI